MRAPRFSSTTPPITRAIPAIFAAVAASPMNTIPMAAIAAVPTPAHIAYAVPTDIVFSVCASRVKAMT